MPLSDEILQQGLSRFMVPDSTAFQKEIDGESGRFPSGGEDLGEFWSKATVAYTTTLSPTPVNALAWTAGLSVMQEALSLGLRPAALPDPTGQVFETVFNTTFSAYGLALGALILVSSPGVYSAFTPPVTLVGTEIKIKVLPVGMAGGTHKDVMEKIAEVVSGWLKSGAVVPVGGPPPIPWT
jgi:hypothetical protein